MKTKLQQQFSVHTYGLESLNMTWVEIFAEESPFIVGERTEETPGRRLGG